MNVYPGVPAEAVQGYGTCSRSYGKAIRTNYTAVGETLDIGRDRHTFPGRAVNCIYLACCSEVSKDMFFLNNKAVKYYV